jgi:hypothetical protein
MSKTRLWRAPRSRLLQDRRVDVGEEGVDAGVLLDAFVVVAPVLRRVVIWRTQHRCGWRSLAPECLGADDHLVEGLLDLKDSWYRRRCPGR